MNGWIDVNERLPELHIEYYEPLEHEQASFTNTSYWISDSVLVTGTSKSTDDSLIFVAMYEDDGFGRTYWDDIFGGTLENVTAWMPLPEPYTADRKTEQTEETEMERLDRINNELDDAWARIRELTDEPQTERSDE